MKIDLTFILRLLLNLFEILSCITGFIYWNKLKNNYWKWFPIYLSVITVLEVTGKYLNYLSMVKKLPQYNPYLYQYFAMPMQLMPAQR